jgi:hypothetical protein
VIRFVLNGTAYQLTGPVVEDRVARHSPEEGHKYLVSIGGRWFPVKQAFEIAIGVRRGEFTSQTGGSCLRARSEPAAG